MKKEEKERLYAEALAELEEEEKEEAMEDQEDLRQDMMDTYPVPEPEEMVNSHSFLHKAAFGSGNTVRTTFLSESELGRPLFNIRFLSDMEDIAKHYVDPLLKKYGMKTKQNLIALYFWNKRENVTESGMSNKGFAMNLNVTRKVDATRKRVRPNFEGMKGGGDK